MEKSNYGKGIFREAPLPEKRIELKPTPRHDRWMQFLNLHGCLSSVYLFALEGEKDEAQLRAAQFQLKRLWLAGYVYRPKQQRATDNANYHAYIYDLTPKGVAYLIERKLWVEAIRPTGNWVHQFMISSITATMDIMCQRNGYRYIPPHEYLGEKLMTASVPFEWETKKEKYTHTLPLAPDNVFAIDYGDNSYIAYALEADRNTEPNASHNWNRKSDLRTIRQYASFIGKNQYQKAYGRNAMMLLLYITVNEGHARNFIDMTVNEIAKCKYIAVGVVPEFATPFKPPELLTHLFEDPLLRSKKKKVWKKYRNKRTGEIVDREVEVMDTWTIKKTA